jgi:DGQHR domain-containing protein
MKLNLLEVTQPIGTFYMACLPAAFVAASCDIIRRDLTGKGIQRVLSEKRVKDIAAYTEDPDATFPTPIIISVNPNQNNSLKEVSQENGVKLLSLEFDEKLKFGEIVDGQHRVEGLKRSEKISAFELPVILMFDLIDEEKAYIFSIINSKQTPVSKSIIYDLFGLFDTPSPQKTCHEMARLMNSDESSPYFKRLKMLGRKQDVNSSLSQGSFVKYLIKLLSRNPDQDLIDLKLKKKLQDDEDPSRPFRYYFIKGEDNFIYKILLNYFKAVESTFPQEWGAQGQFILSKTTGYGALMKALPIFISEGNEQHDLTEDFFKIKMLDFKSRLESANLKLTSEYFPSNEQQQTELAKVIVGRDL